MKQAIQIGKNVGDIMALPCVRVCQKVDDKAGFTWLQYLIDDCQIAEEGDWIVEDEDGKWRVVSNDSFKGL